MYTELQRNEGKKRGKWKRFRDAVYQILQYGYFRGKDNIVEMVNEPYLELVNKTEHEF
jgi:hypothetical protein